jgi:hypothetical protein
VESVRDIPVKLLTNGPSNKTVFVLGATGSGKTTVIANLLLCESRFLIFDVKEEYDCDFFPGAIVIHTCIDLCNALNQGVERIIYKFSRDGDIEEELDTAIICAMEFQLRNKAQLGQLCIALDELNRFVTSQAACHGLREVIMRGRSYNITKIFGAQWFGQIPAWARDSFSELYVFRHTDVNGLMRLESFGLSPEEVKGLSEFCALHVTRKGVEHVTFTVARVHHHLTTKQQTVES